MIGRLSLITVLLLGGCAAPKASGPAPASSPAPDPPSAPGPIVPGSLPENPVDGSSWVVAKLEGASLTRGMLAGVLPEGEEILRGFDRCGLDPVRGFRRIKVAVALAKPAAAAELEGAVTAPAVACALGTDAAPDGTVGLRPDLTVAATATGVRVSSGDDAPEEALSALDLYRDPIVLAAQVGPAGKAIQLLVQARPDGAFGLRLRLVDEAQAGKLYAWLVDAVLRAGRAGSSKLAALRPQLEGRDVVVQGTWSLALAQEMRDGIFEAFRFRSASMVPSVGLDDLLLVAKGALATTPARGDVVVFRLPEGKGTYARRVIALGGDRVKIRDGVLHVNGKALGTKPERRGYRYFDRPPTSADKRRRIAELWREELDGRSYLVVRGESWGKTDAMELKVPERHVFVLADNRRSDGDSRDLGPIPVSAIVGRPVAVLWSLAWARVGPLADAPLAP